MTDKTYGMHIDRDPRLLVEQYLDLGNRSAAAMAKFHYLEDIEKILLAEIKMDFLLKKTDDSGKRYAMNILNEMALASPEYRQHIELMKLARENSYSLVNQFKAEDKVIELTRSLESSVRAQLNKLGA